MYSLIKKMIFLMFYLREIYLNCSSEFCGQRKFDKIYTNKIYENGSTTYSLIDIVINGKTFQWNLETKKKTLIYEDDSYKDILAKIFIPVLPKCAENSDDCNELHKLSNTAITFRLIGTRKDYNITRFVSNEEKTTENTELPWNMSATGDPTVQLEYDLWPADWISQPIMMAAYDPQQKQLIYAINPGGGHTDRLKIKYKSLQNWGKNWKVLVIEEKDKIRISLIGLITLMAVNRQTGVITRNKMDRIFGFVIQSDMAHKVYEYYDNELKESDYYDYYSLFDCPEPKPEDSMGLVFGLIGGAVVVIVLLLISVCVLMFCLSGRNKPTTRVVLKSSSGSGPGSNDSVMNTKKGSGSSRQT